MKNVIGMLSTPVMTAMNGPSEAGTAPRAPWTSRDHAGAVEHADQHRGRDTMLTTDTIEEACD